MSNVFVPEEQSDIGQIAKLAVVGGIYSDGLELTFDGEDEPARKHYMILQSCRAKTGDRVLCQNVSGTYIVVGVVGKTPLIVADGCKSNDDPDDYVRMTYNPTRKVYAVLSKNNDMTWRNIYSV